jgi:hypothetical protein
MGSAIPASPYEWFTLGTRSSYTITGGITTTFPAQPAYDLRQEGNDPALSTPLNQPNPNRGQVCFHNLNSQAITFGPLANRPLNASPLTISATASSGLPVTFSAAGNCSLMSPTGPLTLIGTGPCTITAHQAGNTAYGPAPDVARTFQIVGYAIYLPTILD